MTRRALVTFGLAALSCVPAAAPAQTVIPWPVDGVPLCTAPGDQFSPAPVLGGVYTAESRVLRIVPPFIRPSRLSFRVEVMRTSSASPAPPGAARPTGTRTARVPWQDDLRVHLIV